MDAESKVYSTAAKLADRPEHWGGAKQVRVRRGPQTLSEEWVGDPNGPVGPFVGALVVAVAVPALVLTGLHALWPLVETGALVGLIVLGAIGSVATVIGLVARAENRFVDTTQVKVVESAKALQAAFRAATSLLRSKPSKEQRSEIVRLQANVVELSRLESRITCRIAELVENVPQDPGPEEYTLLGQALQWVKPKPRGVDYRGLPRSLSKEGLAECLGLLDERADVVRQTALVAATLVELAAAEERDRLLGEQAKCEAQSRMGREALTSDRTLLTMKPASDVSSVMNRLAEREAENLARRQLNDR